MKTFWIKLYNYIRYNYKYIHRDLWKGICNLIKWFPLVIKDADWDHYYIMSALQFKIKNTAKYIEKHNRYVGCERDVEIMNTCVRLIDKIQESYYEIEYQDFYKSSINFERVEGTNTSRIIDKDVTDTLVDYFEKYPNDYRRCKSEDMRNITMALEMSHGRHNRAIKILFKLMERNIEKWWD